MGKLLSLLARDNSSDCCGPKSSYDIFLDFENAQPSPSELDVYNEVNRVLCLSDKILEEIQVYKVS
jgi:CYRIA/CYRIB Rac1 binding domain